VTQTDSQKIIADIKAKRDRRRQARKALGPNGGAAAQVTGAPQPTIRIVQGEIPRVVNEAEAALLQLGLEIYQYGDVLVEAHLRLIKASGGREFVGWRLPEVTVMNLVEYFSLAARFERFDNAARIGSGLILPTRSQRPISLVRKNGCRTSPASSTRRSCAPTARSATAKVTIRQRPFFVSGTV